MPKQKITVEFTQKGAPQLTKAIHNLANAKNKLQNQTDIATQQAIKYDKVQQQAVKNAQKQEKAQQRVTKANREGKKGFDGLLASSALLRNKILLTSFAFGLITRPIANVTKAAVNQAAKFQSLQVRLTQLFGSIGEGKAAFEQFNAQAAKTPFALDDIVNAGAQLKAFGADSRELLTEITDLAAFMGTNATEAANAFGRAFAGGAGAADILRERGVLNLVKAFAKVDDISKLTLPEFRKALIGAMRDPLIGIQGATEAMADTYVGRLSNMQDATQRMQADLGNLLMPAAEATMGVITNLANELGRFFKEINESPLATLVREMEELGVEAQKLAGFKIILNTEDSIEKIANLASDVKDLRKELFDLGDFDEFMFMDFGGIGTGMEQMQKMNSFLKDELGESLSSIEKAFAGEGGLFDIENTESMEDAIGDLTGALLKAREEILENVSATGEQTKADKAAFEAGSRNIRYLANLVTKIQQVIKVRKDQADLEDYYQGILEGRKKEEPIFSTDDMEFIKIYKKILADSNEERVKVIDKQIEMLKLFQKEGRFLKANTFEAGQFEIVLKALNDQRDKLLENPIVKEDDVMTLQKMQDELKKQRDEYTNLQTILKDIEDSGFYDENNIPEHLRKLTDGTKKLNEENQKLEDRLTNLYKGTKKSQKEAIQSNIDFLVSNKNNKKMLDSVGMTIDDVDAAIKKYTDDLNKLSGVLELQSYPEFLASIKKQALEFKNSSNNMDTLIKNYALLDEVYKNYIKTQMLGLQTTDDVNKEIALGVIELQNFEDMQKHVEGMYHGMNDMQKKVAESLGFLSDEFKAMNNIGVEETFGNIEQKLESLFQASTKGTVAGFMGDFSEYRKLRSELELQMEATDLTSDKKQELADRIKVLDAGYEILNKQYSDYVNNLHVGGRAQARLTKFMEKHNKISDTGLKAQRDELVAYKASINAIDDQAISTQALTDEKRNAERAILEFDAAQGDTDAAFKLYIMNTEDALAAEKLSKQFKEDLIRDYPVLAEFLGYTAQGYAYYVSQLQLANQKEEESLRNKMHLIRTDVDQARNLGLLGDTYEEFKTNLETQVATRDHLIAKTIKLRAEEGKLYDEMVKSGKIKSVEALTDEKRMANMTSLELLMDRIQKQRREETQTQNDLIALRQQEIDGYNTLYSQGVEMGIIKADVLEIDKNVLATQTELQAMIDEVKFTEMDRIRALQKLLSTSKDLNLTEEQKAIIYEKLNDRYFDIIESEQELIDSRQRLADLDPMDALDVPDTSGFLAKHSGAFSSQIDTLRDARKAYLEEATELGKPFDEIQAKLADFDAAIEEFEIKDKALAIAGGLLDITEMFTDTLAMFVDAYQEKVEKAYQADLERLKLSERYTKANAADQKKMEKQIAEDHADERTKAFNYQKAISLSEVAVSTGRAMMEAYATFWATGGQPWISLIAAFGAAQAGFIAAQQPPSYEYGGLVGGQRHSQGGTIIEAEQGEFVMSRQAVQAMGVENMKKINNLAMDIRDARPFIGLGSIGSSMAVRQGLLEGRYGSGGLVGMSRYGKGGLIQGMQNNEMPKSEPTNIVINFEGNILSDDFIIDEAIPKIREAIRRGDNILE